MVCKFARAKNLKQQEKSNLFGWLTLEMIKLDDYYAISPSFHVLAKLNLFVESVPPMDSLLLWFLG